MTCFENLQVIDMNTLNLYKLIKKISSKLRIKVKKKKKIELAVTSYAEGVTLFKKPNIENNFK